MVLANETAVVTGSVWKFDVIDGGVLDVNDALIHWMRFVAWLNSIFS